MCLLFEFLECQLLIVTEFKFYMISNIIHSKVWDGITYPFLNFNDAAVEA